MSCLVNKFSVYSFHVHTFPWVPHSWSQMQRVPLCWGRNAALRHLCKHTKTNFKMYFLVNIKCSRLSLHVCMADLKVLALLAVFVLLVCWLLPRTLCKMDKFFFLSSSRASSSSVTLVFFSESQTVALITRKRFYQVLQQQLRNNQQDKTQHHNIYSLTWRLLFSHVILQEARVHPETFIRPEARLQRHQLDNKQTTDISTKLRSMKVS